MTEDDETPEPERCPYCGGMFETPCDEPPVDTCEQALGPLVLSAPKLLR